MEKIVAHSMFEIKAIDEDRRIIEGIASTPTTDRVDDIVEPMGAEFSLPLPFLWQHNSREPVGWVRKAKPNKKGIPVTIEVAKTDEPGKLKDLLDFAWQSIKMKLVRGLSIGFMPIESSRIEGTFGFRFTKWDWMELSAVTIPANVEASIQTIKSLDQAALRAASGSLDQRRAVHLEAAAPGASGTAAPHQNQTRSTTQRGLTMKKTLAEQLAAFEAKRAASVARQEEVMGKASDEGRTLTAEESEEYENLKSDIKALDEHIVRLKEQQAAQVARATDVTRAAASPGAASDPAAAAAAARQGVIQVRSNLPKGTAYTRFAMALAASKGNVMQAIQIAESRWKDSTPQVALALKAAVDPGTTTEAAWAGALVDVRQMAEEFIELLRPQTIIGRISGFRRVPFNIKMPRQLTGSTANWVGQGQPKPVSELSFDTVTLGFAKVAGIVVITEELARLSSPSAEAVVQADMIEVIRSFMDAQFIDPSVAAVPNVSPASITNGLTPIVSSGKTLAAIDNDVALMFSAMIAAKISLASLVWVMNPRTAMNLSMVRSSTGDTKAFPEINAMGGTWYGLPVITSESVAVAGTSGEPTFIVLMSAGNILLADDGGINIDVSREASLQMDTAPETGAVSLVSLWQNNLIGLKAERMVNWLKRRPAAAQIMTEVEY